MLQDRRSAVLLRTAYTVSVIGIFLYFLMWQVNFYLAESIKQGIYLFFPPILLTGVLYFRKLKDGIEIKLVAAYLLWVVITRIINGDRVLSKEYLFVLDLSLMLPFMSLGLVLDRAGRRRVLNWLSVILGVYFFVLGGLCLYTFVTGHDVINPITGGYLTARLMTSGHVAISTLDYNPNVISAYFLMSLLLMLYQLFACKSLFWKIPALLAGLMDFLVIALMRSRSVGLSSAVCLGLLAMLIAHRGMRRRGGPLRLALMLTALISVSVAAYLCFGLLGARMESGSARYRERLAEQQMPTSAYTVKDRSAQPMALSASVTALPETEDGLSAAINAASSGRLDVYRAAFRALEEDHSLLVRGSTAAGLMERTNQILAAQDKRTAAHLHNCFLQTLMLTGIPGLLLALGFSFLLLIRIFHFFFLTPDGRLSAKVLALAPIALLLYAQFESCLFSNIDARTLFFCLTCGFALGEYRSAAKKPVSGHGGNAA